MNRTTYAFTTACLLILLLAAPTHALHYCNGDILTIDAEAATFYVDDRSDAGAPFDIRVYLESNGVEGLQSGTDMVCPSIWCDATVPLPFVDPCVHARPDTLIF